MGLFGKNTYVNSNDDFFFLFKLEELEKLLNEGQVFTEFQKVERRSEVSIVILN